MTHVAMYSDAATWGGAEQALTTLVRGLPDRIRLSVIGVDDAVVDGIASARGGVDRFVLAPVRGKTDVRRFLEHRRAIMRIAPDIFHANLNSMSSCQYAIGAALSVRDVRVVAHEHSPFADGSRLSLVLKRHSAARLAAHVAVGAAAARTIEQAAGLPADSIRTITNAVPGHDAAPVEVEWRRPAIGSVGRLEPLKGYDVLLRATGGLDTDVVLIGSGSERDVHDLEQVAADAGGGSRLHLAGWRTDARDLLPHFDVFALPSRLEGLPLVILEAMHAGLPVVATDVGSVAELVEDGVTGYVVPVDDHPAMRDSIQRLLDDADLRRRMGEAGRRRAQSTFSVEALVAAWTDVYDTVAATVAPGR